MNRYGRIYWQILFAAAASAVSAAMYLGQSLPLASANLQEGWGNVTGQVVYGGEPIPQRQPIPDVKEPACLAKGNPLTEQWVVDPKTRGVRWAVIFLKPAKGQTIPVHPALQKPASDTVILDQPTCAFEPHVVTMRAGQKLVANNPMTIAHNVVITGFRNNFNIQIPPGQRHVFELQPETYRPLPISCGAHPWMRAYLWMFDHPYFAVTDETGHFTIKNAPAGTWNLVVWHEAIGYLGGAAGRDGKPIDIKAGQTTDLGKIEIKPAQ
jgi:plastocyanin